MTVRGLLIDIINNSGTQIMFFSNIWHFFVFNVMVYNRLWDIECGACLRVLEGHEELVR